MPNHGTGPIGGGRRGAFGDVTAAQALAEAESSRNPLGRSRVGVPTVATDDPADLANVLGFLGPFGALSIPAIALRDALGLEQDNLSLGLTMLEALDIDPLAMLGLTDEESPAAFSPFSGIDARSANPSGLAAPGSIGAQIGRGLAQESANIDSRAIDARTNESIASRLGVNTMGGGAVGRSGGGLPPGGVHGPMTAAHSSMRGGLGGAGTGPGGMGGASSGAPGSAGHGGVGPGGAVGGAPAGASGVGGGFSGGASEGGVFMQGGYTGTHPAPGSQVMGRVHEGEYVIPRDIVETPLGRLIISVLEQGRMAA